MMVSIHWFDLSGLMLASVGIGHQNSPLFAMYLSVGADGGGYTISVPIKMRYLSSVDASCLFQVLV